MRDANPHDVREMGDSVVIPSYDFGRQSDNRHYNDLALICIRFVHPLQDTQNIVPNDL